MFDNFRSVIESSDFSSVRGNEKDLYRETVSDTDPLLFYDSSGMKVEVYEDIAPLNDLNHPFRLDKRYLVRFELAEYTGFLSGTEEDVSKLDRALVDELDDDGKYKKIVQDLS